jgi:hypothetical protein
MLVNIDATNNFVINLADNNFNQDQIHTSLGRVVERLQGIQCANHHTCPSISV